MTFSGVYPSPPDNRDYRVGKIFRPVAIPEKVRMDDQFTILDQGFCGTCVGKASNGLMSAKFKTKLSSLFIYALCKQFDGIPELEGTFPRTAMQIMKNYGSCLDETLPYERLKDCLMMPLITDKMKEEGLKRRITVYARAYNLFEIMQALALGHLVLIVIKVGDNFIYYQGGVMGEATGADHGYHAVVLCGYEDGKLRGVNSWGKNWGEDGFFWFASEVFSTSTIIEMWVVEITEEPIKLSFCSKLKKLLHL